MSTIDTSYFFGERSLAFPDTPAGTANMQQFIDAREAELLQKLFGYSLYKAWLAGQSDQRMVDIKVGKEFTPTGGHLTKWQGLIFTIGAAKKSLIADYVYWFYQTDNYTFTTGSSEKKTDLAINANPDVKMVTAWNEMVNFNDQFHAFILANIATYPEYKDSDAYNNYCRGWWNNNCDARDLFTFKNRYGF